MSLDRPALAHRVHPLVRLGLDADARCITRQQCCDVPRHDLHMVRQARTLEDHRCVKVSDTQARCLQALCRIQKESGGVGPLIDGVVIGEKTTNIAFSQRTENRIRHCVVQNIAVGMADRPGGMIQCDSSENEWPTLAIRGRRRQSMQVISMADTDVRSCPHDATVADRVPLDLGSYARSFHGEPSCIWSIPSPGKHRKVNHMMTPHRYPSALLLALLFLAGCALHSPSGSLLSRPGGSHTYYSSELSPKTVTLTDLRTSDVLFSLDIPAGKQLTFDFIEGDGNDPVYAPDTMRWDLWDIGARFGFMQNSLSVPPAGSRHIAVSLRSGPEYIEALPDRPLRADEVADHAAFPDEQPLNLYDD